jgi:hypothetical protein
MTVALGGTAFASATPAPGHAVVHLIKHGSKSSMAHHMMTGCPTGEHMVHGYTKKNGTKVAPYCR